MDLNGGRPPSIVVARQHGGDFEASRRSLGARRHRPRILSLRAGDDDGPLFEAFISKNTSVKNLGWDGCLQ